MSANELRQDPIQTADTANTSRQFIRGQIAVASGRQWACRTRMLSLEHAEVVTAADGVVGETALCRLDAVGLLPGRIESLSWTGLTLALELCAVRRERVATRLAWLAALNERGIDQRASPRIVPHSSAVVIQLLEQTCIMGEIEDLSMSGARIRLAAPHIDSHRLVPGMTVTTGKRYAVIVRVEAGVIAVRFRLPFSGETFNPTVVL